MAFSSFHENTEEVFYNRSPSKLKFLPMHQLQPFSYLIRHYTSVYPEVSGLSR
jgi:hypothetical protein